MKSYTLSPDTFTLDFNFTLSGEILDIIEEENQRRSKSRAGLDGEAAIVDSWAPGKAKKQSSGGDGGGEGGGEDGGDDVSSLQPSQPSQPLQPITLINDSCLAFSVLVHNDGGKAEGGGNGVSMRVLDLSEHYDTPIMVTLDAHKHLGTDKGISTVTGTPGTLAALDDHIKVGSGPRHEDLVRGLASMRLVGEHAYLEKYRALGTSIR
jgi:hypothetical protein